MRYHYLPIEPLQIQRVTKEKLPDIEVTEAKHHNIDAKLPSTEGRQGSLT